MFGRNSYFDSKIILYCVLNYLKYNTDFINCNIQSS